MNNIVFAHPIEETIFSGVKTFATGIVIWRRWDEIVCFMKAPRNRYDKSS